MSGKLRLPLSRQVHIHSADMTGLSQPLMTSMTSTDALVGVNVDCTHAAPGAVIGHVQNTGADSQHASVGRHTPVMQQRSAPVPYVHNVTTAAEHSVRQQPAYQQTQQQHQASQSPLQSPMQNKLLVALADIEAVQRLAPPGEVPDFGKGAGYPKHGTGTSARLRPFFPTRRCAAFMCVACTVALLLLYVVGSCVFMVSMSRLGRSAEKGMDSLQHLVRIVYNIGCTGNAPLLSPEDCALL